MMDRNVFVGVVSSCFNILRESAPVDTRNLKNNAITLIWEDEDTVKIYIDTNIAPYMPYTNEPWVSSWWNGRQNPNLYWFDFAFLNVLRFLEERLGGIASRADGGRVICEEALAESFKNKTGDYFPEDVWTHSEYISNSADAVTLLTSRFNLLKGVRND